MVQAGLNASVLVTFAFAVLLTSRAPDAKIALTQLRITKTMDTKRANHILYEIGIADHFTALQNDDLFNQLWAKLDMYVDIENEPIVLALLCEIASRLPEPVKGEENNSPLLSRQLLESIDGMEKSSMTPSEILRHLKHEIALRAKPVTPLSETREC
jgi:hypothetical protein